MISKKNHFKKLTKAIAVSLGLFMFTMNTNVALGADAFSLKDLQKPNNEIIEGYTEIKTQEELDMLVRNYKQKMYIPNNVTVTEEDNKVTIEQTLKRITKKSGEILEEKSQTVIEEVEIPIENNNVVTRDSQGTSGSDSSFGCKVYTTVYYDRLTYENKPSVKMTSIDWSVVCNSGVRVYNMVERIGQVGAVGGTTNQISERTHIYTFTSKSGVIAAPYYWKPAIAHSTSLVGITLEFQLGRDANGKKWFYSYTNNLRL